MVKWLIAGAVVGGLVAVWVLWGRFAVEGGPAEWAVINNRPDVLKESLAGSSDKQKESALRRASSRGRAEMVSMLLGAGAKPNPPAKGHCVLSSAVSAGSTAAVTALLEAGADPSLCQDEKQILTDYLKRNHNRVSQGEQIQLLSMLIKKGLATEAALDLAQDYHLDQVVAYLKNPGAAVPANVPKLALFGGQTKLEADDLKKICKGEGVSGLPPYEKKAGLISPVYYFEKRFEEYRWPGMQLPQWWTFFEDVSHTQVVACVAVTNKTKVQNCEYEGRGGGISIYDADYQIVVREARTGKQIAEKSLSLKISDTHCPMIKSGADQEGIYPPYQEQLAAFVGPLIQ